MKEFGARVRELRSASGLTLRELAKRAKIDFTYLSKIETGKLPYTPASSTIRALAGAMGADPIELLSLANKLPPELDKVSNVPEARRFIERARRVASPDDWEALLDLLERRQADRKESKGKRQDKTG